MAEETEESNKYMAVGLAVGAPFGAVIGMLLFDNLALGIPVGMLLGMAVGIGVDSDRRKKSTPDDDAETDDSTQP